MRRLGLALAGLLLALLLLEAGLRIAAGFGGNARREGAKLLGEGGIRVVCLGDSNVYGYAVRDEETFPARLEARLNAGATGPHRVVNLGVPGFSSLHVLLRVAGAIEDHAPSAVVVLCGVNDNWNRPEGGAERSLLENLRVVRLFRLLAARARARRATPEENDVRRGLREQPLRGGGTETWDLPDRAIPAEWPQARAALREDLGAMAALCAERRVRLVLATYALSTEPFGSLNATIRAISSERGLPLADFAESIRRASERWPIAALVFSDGHPKPPGYALFAATVHEALVRAGIAPGDPVDPLDAAASDPLFSAPALARFDRTRPRLRLLDDPGGPWIEVDEEPGTLFRVLLSGRPKPLGEGSLPKVPLEPDALFLAATRRPELEGTVPASGPGRVSLRPFLDAVGTPAGARFYAAYGVYRERIGPAFLVEVSAPVEMALR